MMEATFATLAEIELAHIVTAVGAYSGNVTAMAKALGISRSTMHRKLQRLATKGRRKRKR